MRRWLLGARAAVGWPCCAAPARRYSGRPRPQRCASTRPPQRIVSLLPSLTEFVCALGACERLVGVDDFSNCPAVGARSCRTWAAWRTRAIESIVGAAARPGAGADLLARAGAAAGAGPAGAGAGAAHLRRRAARAARCSGPLLAARDAGAVWREIEQDLRAAARAVPPALRGTPRVLRGQRRALCGQRGLVHRRAAGRAGRCATSCRARWALSQAQPRVRACAPTPT